jgi:hypothetical protein
VNFSSLSPALTTLLSELVDGANTPGGAFVLNSGDVGLLRSLQALSARQASASVHEGATIAAHARHLQYGLSLLNEAVKSGANPYANAKWDEAWKTTTVDEKEWTEIRSDLGREVRHTLELLPKIREVSELELTGIIGSVVHLAYHLGAIRQIDKSARGPKEGTFI